MLFKDAYKGKKVLVTGHTGFKGSWLSAWLLELGAEVVGYSIDVPTVPSNFEVMGLREKLKHIDGDVRDLDALEQVFKDEKPNVVFHLAAQAITRRAYDVPVETFGTNVLGTVNVLECIRRSGGVRAAVMITSDKCYQNVEWEWGYRENDRLGGDDPYSASKAAAENVCRAYIKSYFMSEDSANVATVRAGNVIGGGDWALDRIVPDAARAFAEGRTLQVRSPGATRPWQHVLEPLGGYLWLGTRLIEGDEAAVGEPFNFGPSADVSHPVGVLIDEFKKTWHGEYKATGPAGGAKKESNLLKLNCDKALHRLDWHPTLDFEEAVRMTAQWYGQYYGGKGGMHALCIEQIKGYVETARLKGIRWTEK